MDKEERIKIELEQTKKNLSENLDRLPKEDLPFMEPHLRSIYYQIYFLIAYGFYDASIVLVGIFLESITKEKLFIGGVLDEKLENMDFGSAISECKRRKSLSSEEITFLQEKKEKIRNPYLHNNQIKIAEGKEVVGWEIKDPVNKLINLMERVRGVEITEEQARKELIKDTPPKLLNSRTFRPAAHIIRCEEVKEKSFNIFLEIDKFVRAFAIKYFKAK
jgi:hypothetical protein